MYIHRCIVGVGENSVPITWIYTVDIEVDLDVGTDVDIDFVAKTQDIIIRVYIRIMVT